MATEQDKVNTGALGTLVVLGVLAVIGIALAVMALTRDAMSAELAEKESTNAQTYRALASEQRAKLLGGTTIDQYMQRVVADLQRDPLSATPGATASAAASAPAPSATPPAPSATAPAAASVTPPPPPHRAPLRPKHPAHPKP